MQRQRRRGGGGGWAAGFDGGQEPSRVMNFSVGCFRKVTRTRTGVRKQVVADICSAQGPGCLIQALPLSLNFYPHPCHPPHSPQLASRPFPPPVSAAAGSQAAGLSADAEERQQMRVKQFFYGLTFTAGGPSTPKVERGWTQLRCRTCPRHK